MIGQRETIKQVLGDGQYHCGTEFQKLFIPEYRMRINELRKKDSMIIETRRCQQHQHKGVMYEWRFASTTLPASPATQKVETCCFSMQVFGHHERACQKATARAKPTLF